MKRGEITVDTVVQIIVGIGASVIIVLLVLALIPSFSPEDDIAEAYLDRLKESVVEADEGVPSNFFMLDDGKDEVDFYLAYFGDTLEFEATRAGFVFDDDVYFRYPDGQSENSICVCYWNDVTIRCKECWNLELPAVLNSFEDGKVTGSIGSWAVREGVSLDIVKDGDGYDFSIK